MATGRDALRLLALLALLAGSAPGGPDPGSVGAAGGEEADWRRRGEVTRRACDLAAAEDAYDRALALDPFDPGARAGIAEVRRLEGSPAQALAHAATGLALPRGRGDARLWREKSLALTDLSRLDEAVAAGRAAVRLAPGDFRASEALARALYRRGDGEGAAEAYRRAVALDPFAEEANLRLGNGFGPRDDARPWEEERDRTLFLKAVERLEVGDHDAAVARFGFLADRSGGSWKYRLGIGLALVAARREREVRFGGDPTAIYRLLPLPEIPDAERFVPGLERLGAGERHAVLVALAPARAYLPALLAAGGSHETFSVAEDLTTAPGRRALAGQDTFDGRRYEHLRGVGGLAAATGVEKLREAASFGFHTFAHEFAHQVMDHVLEGERREEIARRHAAAVGSGRALDWYAASNPEEYFAQGYEAFVSLAKRGCLKDTERHTREELARRDPDLHALLLSLFDLSYESPEALASFRAALPP